MTLTTRQIEMIEFCEEPKLVQEIAERFEINTRSVYPYLRRLINDGFIKSESGYVNLKGKAFKFFVSIKSASDAHLMKDVHQVDEEKINMDFVRAAHNPFNLGARHG
jgi:predicted transcriptional regulator